MKSVCHCTCSHTPAPLPHEDLNACEFNHTSLNLEPVRQVLYSFSLCASHKELQGSPAPGFTCEEEEEPSGKKTGRLLHLQTLTAFSKRLIMQQNMSLLCSAVWLFLVYFARVCPSAHKHSTCGHDRHSQIHHHQKTFGARKFCDPSFSSHTAGAITQVRQLFVGFSAAGATFPLTLKIVLTHLSFTLFHCIQISILGHMEYLHISIFKQEYSSVGISPHVSPCHTLIYKLTPGEKKHFLSDECVINKI